MISQSSFVADFPEFNNTVMFPVSSVNYWINFATLLISPGVLGGPGDSPPKTPPDNLYDIATELFTAHNLVLEAVAQKDANAGNIPGLTPGLVTNKHVGPISASYNVTVGVDPNDGQYNLTIYGTRFINLYKMAGAPGFVANGHGINPAFGPFPPTFGTSPWPGPPLWGWGQWI